MTLFHGNSFFNSLCESNNFIHDEQPAGHPGPPEAHGLPADQQSPSSRQGWPGSVPCCRWRQKERCRVESFRAGGLRCACGAVGRLALPAGGSRRGGSRGRGAGGVRAALQAAQGQPLVRLCRDFTLRWPWQMEAGTGVTNHGCARTHTHFAYGSSLPSGA